MRSAEELNIRWGALQRAIERPMHMGSSVNVCSNRTQLVERVKGEPTGLDILIQSQLNFGTITIF